MISYEELYEILRKEKYSDTLQPLPKNFLVDISTFLAHENSAVSLQNDSFSDTSLKQKKQLENALSLFKELILRRKKKILNLIFVATETGITKRDYENMLEIEKETFDNMIKIFEKTDRKISQILSNTGGKKGRENKMILFNQNVEQFVDHVGTLIGPFKTGELANIDFKIANILVSEKKASFVDEQ